MPGVAAAVDDCVARSRRGKHMFKSHVKRDRYSAAALAGERFISLAGRFHGAGTVADLISNSDCETSWMALMTRRAAGFSSSHR